MLTAIRITYKPLVLNKEKCKKPMLGPPSVLQLAPTSSIILHICVLLIKLIKITIDFTAKVGKQWLNYYCLVGNPCFHSAPSFLVQTLTEAVARGTLTKSKNRSSMVFPNSFSMVWHTWGQTIHSISNIYLMNV